MKFLNSVRNILRLEKRRSRQAYLSVEESRVRYEDGFRELETEAQKDPVKYQNITRLIYFKKSSVGWASVDGDAIRALGDGNFASWLIVYPQYHKYVKDSSTPLLKMSTASVRGIHIKPFALSGLWASLFLVHELTHLYDQTMGIEPMRPSRNEYLDGEVRAFRNEWLAADLVSHDEYSKMLKDEYIALGSPTLEGLYDLVKGNVRKVLEQTILTLDKTVSDQTALSEDEDALRVGLHLMSLALYSVDVDPSIPDDQKYAHYRAAVNNMMMLGGAGNYIPA